MKEKIKLWVRRRTLRWLRKLVDLADDRLHAAEVRFREQVSRVGHGVYRPPLKRVSNRTRVAPTRENFQQWEARRSGVAVISKKEARRRRALTAAQFDRRFLTA